MNITIHRGSHEIGGSCIELKTSGSRLLMDLGLPLVDENQKPFKTGEIFSKKREELINQGLLPNIQGLYEGEYPIIDAVLLSHPHQDHYGLMSFINSEIPVYMSQGCQILIEVAHFFSQTNYNPQNIQTVKPWKPFVKGDFKITPYLVDHSGFDSLAYLIEAEGIRIFYSGDFRGHGRKSIVYENILKNPPENIDYLILEGSMIGRENEKHETEQDIENDLTNQFKTSDNLFFVACSSQNIDRIVSVYRACIKSDRIFVIDPYTAYVLDELNKVSSNIPQLNWNKNIKVFFIPNNYTRKMANSNKLFKFKDSKITYQEMKVMKNRLVVKDSFAVREYFAKKDNIAQSRLIYSLWEGYLPEVKSFWDTHNVTIIKIHTSGHAYIEELRSIVNALKPKYIIPNHTFFPEKYAEYFGDNIKLIQDREEVVL